MSRMSVPALLLALALAAGCGANSPSPDPGLGPVSGADTSADPSADPSAGSASATPTASAGTDPDADGELVPDGLTDNLPDLTNTPKPGLPRPSAAAGRVFGADVSWPQCPKGMGIPEKPTQGSPMPTEAAEFVILGLTNGPSFTPNPCLADQLAWIKERHLLGAAYAVVSRPDADTLKKYGTKGPFRGATRLGALSNVGYQAALFNIATMRAAGLRSPFVWIDVEPVPRFDWGNDTVANAAVVTGTARGYTDAGYAVGYYSTPSLWSRVVGDLRTGAPEWRAAGQTSMAEALSRCGPDWSIQGGSAVFGQWVEDGRDRNVTCPGASTDLGRYFHQY